MTIDHLRHASPGAYWSRALPYDVVLDDSGDEVAWWGPRPDELQAYFTAQRASREKGELYRDLRSWYVRDRGRTTLTEVLELLEAHDAEAA